MNNIEQSIFNDKELFEKLVSFFYQEKIILKRFYYIKSFKITNNKCCFALDTDNNFYSLAFLSKEKLKSQKKEYLDYVSSCIDMVNHKGGNIQKKRILSLY